MNIKNGEIITPQQLEALSSEEQKNYIPIERDLSKAELASKQISLYSPCGCGSGKKFKFCCFKPKV